MVQSVAVYLVGQICLRPCSNRRTEEGEQAQEQPMQLDMLRHNFTIITHFAWRYSQASPLVHEGVGVPASTGLSLRSHAHPELLTDA